jgi:hypothetical protein
MSKRVKVQRIILKKKKKIVRKVLMLHSMQQGSVPQMLIIHFVLQVACIGQYMLLQLLLQSLQAKPPYVQLFH